MQGEGRCGREWCVFIRRSFARGGGSCVFLLSCDCFKCLFVCPVRVFFCPVCLFLFRSCFLCLAAAPLKCSSLSTPQAPNPETLNPETHILKFQDLWLRCADSLPGCAGYTRRASCMRGGTDLMIGLEGARGHAQP